MASLLKTVIEEGNAEAFVLSAQQPYATKVAYSPGRLEELWYYATEKGNQSRREFPDSPVTDYSAGDPSTLLTVTRLFSLLPSM